MATTSISQKPTTADKLERLPWSIASNAANTVFVQFTFFGSAFILLLSELQLNNSQIGFLLSLFPFFGLIALFITNPVARTGFKRVYLTFFGTRKVVTAFLLFLPLVTLRLGVQAGLIYVTIIVILFALCRAVAESAAYPWIQEYIPNSVRGRYSAINNISSQSVGIMAVAFASFIVGRSEDLNRFLLLIGLGVVFGGIAVLAATKIPGGAPVKLEEGEKIGYHQVLNVRHDKNFRKYLAGLVLFTISAAPVTSFLPLFMGREVGLGDGQVVFLQTGILVGGIGFTFFWGWAADRYGSKPILMVGILLKLPLIIGLIFMPRGTPIAFYIALALAFLQGVANMGWGIGSARLLYVGVVPTKRRTEYMAVYYAMLGVFGGLSLLVFGRLLDFTAGLSVQGPLVAINSFTPLFVISFFLTLFSLLVFSRVHGDSGYSLGQFAGMFFRGNPFLALSTMARYYRAKEERDTVLFTEQLGQTKSPLAVNELLDALQDPRFNVRYEAIIAMSRMNPDPRLNEALEQIVMGTELAMTTVAVWALGRIGDQEAIGILRKSLHSDFRSIRAQSARSLGTLGDQEVIPILLARLDTEKEIGLRMAYAVALGNLKATQAIPDLLSMMAALDNQGARTELAYSLARMVGEEAHFVELWRQQQADLGTTVARSMVPLKKDLGPELAAGDAVNLLETCMQSFAEGKYEEGSQQLASLIRTLPPSSYPAEEQLILSACAGCLERYGAERPECVILAVHTLLAYSDA